MKADVKGFLRKSILYYTIIASASLMLFIRLWKNGRGWEGRWCKGGCMTWKIIKNLRPSKMSLKHFQKSSTYSGRQAGSTSVWVTLEPDSILGTENWNGCFVICPRALVLPLPEWFVSLRRSISALSPHHLPLAHSPAVPAFYTGVTIRVVSPGDRMQLKNHSSKNFWVTV